MKTENLQQQINGLKTQAEQLLASAETALPETLKGLENSTHPRKIAKAEIKARNIINDLKESIKMMQLALENSEAFDIMTDNTTENSTVSKTEYKETA